MTKVLLTGASGFIAKHILRELLEKGYAVRASIRSERRKAEIQALFPEAEIEFATLDLSKDDGWDTALSGVDVLMHTASPFPLAEPKDPQELIRPAVDGTLRALKAAKAAGVDRVIMTSSCVAIYKDASKPKMMPSDEGNWTTADAPYVSAYEASKTLAEKAAWDFVAQTPEIALTTINPGLVFGPAMDEYYGTSLNIVDQMMNGQMPMVPNMHMVTVDVRDVARMHVAAINLEATKGERFIASSDAMSFLELGQSIKATIPDAKTPKRIAPDWLLRAMALFAKDVRAITPNLGRNLLCSNKKAPKTFGMQFIPTRDAVVASAQSVRAFGK
ncbi:MAG: NAD-dependent epimerase/dehydratase family protein [Pseudomonadota bacterium]